jgi:hypothetical protein
MPRADRSAKGGSAEAASRLRMARTYLDAAELVANERHASFTNVTAGLAVLAGIAASDAICCVRLGRYHRGEDHRGATDLLRTATPDGRELGTRLERLLGLKDTAHYGATLIPASAASNAVRWARQLVERAQEELER